MRTKTILVAAVFLFWLSEPDSASADEVTPNDRVENRLRVRAQANTSSTIVGFLSPGETADLTGDVPYWYTILLDDGTSGFVSKAYSRVIPDAPPSEVLSLGSWNIRKLGWMNGKDYPLVADIIEDNFDVLAVVEVMQRQGEHPGFDLLLAELGAGWAGIVTDEPRPATNSGNAEYYAVYYRTDRVQPCADWTSLVYHADNDGGASGSGTDHFAREPAFICLSADNFDFILAAYHATWSDGDIGEISDEVEELEAVFDAMAAAESGEEDFLILGDFNLVPSDLEAATNREVPTVGTGSTLNGSGERTQNLYDHLLVRDSDQTSELIGTAEVIDVRAVAPDNKTFFESVSDHLPIVARFNVSGPDDD